MDWRRSPADNATPAGRVAPRFEVDPLWPKPLPNHWVIGSMVGVTVGSRGHVWIGGNGPDDAHILKFTRNGQFSCCRWVSLEATRGAAIR